MSALADALQPLIATGVFSVGGRLESISLTGAITARTSAYAVNVTVGWNIELDFRDPRYVSAVLASDASRLATSCLQSVSIAVAEEDEKYWLPWWVVRLYYAAFYGAHAVLRFLGAGCCWLEATDVGRLASVLHATTGQDLPIKKGGPFRCDADTSSGRLLWSRLDGRPHEALWMLFDRVLRETGENVLRGPMRARDAQAVFAQLEAFRSIGSHHQNSSWLSRLRNDVQYKLAYDVWHPTAHDRRARDRLKRVATQWADDPMGIDLSGVIGHSPLVQFSAACAFVIGLCRVIVVRVSERNASGARSFLSYGPVAYAHAIELAL